MAKKTELIVEIDADGKVHVEVTGAKGKRCLEYLELMKAILGPVESQQTTAEFHEQESVDGRAAVDVKTRTRG